MDNKPREAKQECLRRIAQMRRARGAESDWSTLLGEAARSLGVRPACPPRLNLRDPAAYLNFFGQTLEYAAFPHKSKHHLTLGSDIAAKSGAWEWICEQITAGGLHPEWIHGPLIDQLGVVFAYLFHKIGDCRSPVRIGRTVASQLFVCWNAIPDLRTANNGWALA